jgi:hypothetical protein
MPGFVLHAGASTICPHGGQISYITSNIRVSVSKQKVVTSGDVFPIAGCVFNVASAPHPCVNVKWIVPATRILVNGQPALLSDSVGLCQSADQSPQGPPSVIVTQLRVKGM